jgi:hypothetical protein
MKKWAIGIFTILLISLTQIVSAQTYTQTFIDKCSGEKKVATTTMMNGYATVSFIIKLEHLHLRKYKQE